MGQLVADPAAQGCWSAVAALESDAAPWTIRDAAGWLCSLPTATWRNLCFHLRLHRIDGYRPVHAAHGRSVSSIAYSAYTPSTPTPSRCVTCSRRRSSGRRSKR